MTSLSVSFLCLVVLLNCCATRTYQYGVDNSGSDDVYLNSFQFIQKYGYHPEEHRVETSDGYEITLFRIVRNGPPVLLAHGISDSSDSWLVLGPKNSLAYLLADAGYDVWLLNSRGNKYSKSYTKNISAEQYWDFSFDEMGAEDLPATIDHILAVTSTEKLHYVGFSQGTTIFLIMCSLRPEYNEKIQQAILLAPVAWISHTRYPFIAKLSKNLDVLKLLFKSLNIYEIFPWNVALNKYHATFCRIGQATKIFCDVEYLISYGVRNSSSISPERFPVIASHIPAGTSTNTFAHFIGNYRSKRFQRFDRGRRNNLKFYNSSKPPEFNLNLVTTPVVLFTSDDDWFSSPEDVQTLVNKLPNVVKRIHFEKTLEFTHIEYIYGSRSKKYVNDKILNILLNS